VASNADWSTRRKGPKLETFVGGLWACAQEPYSDIWDLGCAVFRDAAVCGIGHVKVWSDVDAGRVIHERVFPWELLVDATDSKYGRPNNLFQVTTIPRATLIALFPECSEALERTKGGTDWDDATIASVTPTASYGVRVVEMVRCYEWWSLPLSTAVPGKHVLAFADGILIEEAWKRDTFPFGSVRWSREFQGWHGRSLIDEISAIDDEMNDLVARVVRTVRLTGMGTIFKHIDDATPDPDNDDATVVRFEGPVPPTMSSPSPISPVHVQLIELLKGAAYEFSGVNQMTATAQKQAGIESGSAIRLVADLQSERFAVVWRAYQQLFVDVARHDIACVRELAIEDPKFAVKWPGAGFLSSISWSSVDLEDELYVIQIASAPSVKGTPADRLQTAQELYAAGNLSADAMMAVRTYLDLPGELDRSSRQRNVIEQYIEGWLDADEHVLASKDLATVTREDGSPLFRPPVRWMRLEDALLQVVDGYLQAELDNAPDSIKELFLRWIEMADTEIQKRQARLAALKAPPMAPPGGPPAMAPPGAMPMPMGGPAA
jgi:hypothetical protein